MVATWASWGCIWRFKSPARLYNARLRDESCSSEVGASSRSKSLGIMLSSRSISIRNSVHISITSSSRRRSSRVVEVAIVVVVIVVVVVVAAAVVVVGGAVVFISS